MSELIVRSHRSVEIFHRKEDRYIDASTMSKAYGKRWRDYFRRADARAFLTQLSSDMGFEMREEMSELPRSFGKVLVVVCKGRRGGVWIHPRVAIHFAQWLDPAFTVAVSVWMEELLDTGHVSLVQPPQPSALENAVVALTNQVTALCTQMTEVQRSLAARHQSPAPPSSGALYEIVPEQVLGDQGIREQLNGIVRSATGHWKCRMKSLYFTEVTEERSKQAFRWFWAKVYREMYYRHRVNIVLRAEHAGMKLLDYVEELMPHRMYQMRDEAVRLREMARAADPIHLMANYPVIRMRFVTNPVEIGIG